MAEPAAPGRSNRLLELTTSSRLYPKKLLLMGANYYDHVHNDAGISDFRKAEKIPTLFFKPPTTSLVGSGKSVRYPTQSKKFDWEIKLPR